MRRQCLDAGPMGRILDGSCFLQPWPPWARKSKQIAVCPGPRLFLSTNHAGSLRSWTRPWTFCSAPVDARLIGFVRGCSRGRTGDDAAPSWPPPSSWGGIVRCPLPAARRRSMQVLVSHAIPIGQPSRVRCPIGRHRGEGEPGGAPRGAGEPWLARRGLDTAAIDGPLVLGAAYASTPTALLCFLRSRWRQGGLVVAWGGFPHLRSVGQQEKRWCGHKCTSSTAETPDSGQFHDGSADLSQGILFRPVILNRYIHHRRRHAFLSPSLDWLDPSRHPTHPPALPPRTSII